MRIVHSAQKGIAICFLMCGFVIFAHAQTTTLKLMNGKAIVKKTFQPRKVSDAHFYFLKLRKGQTVEIIVNSNSIYLTEENECAVYFQLFDSKGEEVFIGDSMVGIDIWEDQIKAAGNYKIKVYMSGLEGFTTKELLRKKPMFKYLLAIQIKR